MTQYYDGSPHTNRKFDNQLTTHKRHQNFDYATIEDRLKNNKLNNNMITCLAVVCVKLASTGKGNTYIN